jgi:hypothetical protein
MKSVSQIAFAVIICDQGIGHEFEVDTIAMACDAVMMDRDVIALPHMNTVGNLVFRVRIAMQLVIFNPGLRAIRKIYSEEGVFESVVQHPEVFAIHRFDSSEVVHAGDPGIDKFQAFDNNIAGLDGEDLKSVFSIQHRIILSQDGERFLDPDIAFPVDPIGNNKRITRCSHCNAFSDGVDFSGCANPYRGGRHVTRKTIEAPDRYREYFLHISKYFTKDLIQIVP